MPRILPFEAPREPKNKSTQKKQQVVCVLAHPFSSQKFSFSSLVFLCFACVLKPVDSLYIYTSIYRVYFCLTSLSLEVLRLLTTHTLNLTNVLMAYTCIYLNTVESRWCIKFVSSSKRF